MKKYYCSTPTPTCVATDVVGCYESTRSSQTPTVMPEND